MLQAQLGASALEALEAGAYDLNAVAGGLHTGTLPQLRTRLPEGAAPMAISLPAGLSGVKLQ